MMHPRRAFLRLTAAAAALAALPRAAAALDYPTRPAHVIVGFPPGLAPDIVARLIGQVLSERLGQQFVVENRPGAGANMATEAVAHAEPDGYTLLLCVSTNTINETLYHHLNFDFVRDIVAGRVHRRQPVHHGGQSGRCRSRPFPSSSPMPKPIRARSTWPRPASAPRRIWSASCSR